jgi:hypothetical protein
LTTSTLFSTLSYDQNAAGPPVPALTVVNAGGLITRAEFTLTVTPSTGWAEAAVSYGPDGVNFPGTRSLFEAPTGTGSITTEHRFHGGTNQPSNTTDGAQYFQASLVTISPGATATLTITY